jgi:hypothetical protein
MIQMDNRSILALVLVVAASTAIAFVLYRRTSPTLPLRLRVILGIIRWLAAFLLLALVLDPTLRLARTTSRAPVVAVLVDASRSMAHPAPDGKANALETALSAGFLDQLERKADVKYFAFSDIAAPLTREAAVRPGAAGSRTDVAGGIARALEALDAKPSALVLVTDGAANYGEDALHFCSALKIPVYPISLARPQLTPDISVDRVETNETAYAGSRVPVAVYLSGRSAPVGSTTLVIADSTGQVLSQAVVVPESGARQRFVAELDAGQVGLHGFTATLAPFDGEEVTANNSLSFSINVVEGKIKVTVVAPHPSWDFAFTRRNLESDPNLELAVVFSPGSAMAIKSKLVTNDLRRAIAASDVVMVLPGARLGPASGDLQQAVWKGGAALLVAPDATADVAEAMNPLVVAGSPQGTALFGPELAEGGVEHGVLDVDGARGGRIWSSLPPVPVDRSVTGVKPEATVLLWGVDSSQPGQSGGGSRVGDVPMLAVMRHGLGRVAALAGSEMWRWDIVPRGFGMEEPAFRYLLAGCVRWLTEGEETKRLALSTTKSDYLWGEPVAVLARVVSDDLRPLAGAEVETRIRSGDDGAVALRTVMTERSAGSQSQVADLLPPGRYTVAAAARINGEIYAEDTARFSISGRGLEDTGFDGDDVLLREIAEATGGRAYGPDQAGDLADDLNPGRVIATTYKDLRLRINVPTFLVLAGLLGIEWLVRRRKLLA